MASKLFKPHKSWFKYCLYLAMGYTTLDYALWKRSPSKRVQDTLERGTRPQVKELKYECNRQELLSDLDKLLHPPALQKKFQVIVGPAGCGKSWAVKTAANKSPKGVIYIDAEQLRHTDYASFPEKLGKAVGMTFAEEPSPSLLETIRVKISLINRELVHYHLPFGGPEKQLKYVHVLHAIESEASKYQRANGIPPTIIIDDADRLAWSSYCQWQPLITQFKRLAKYQFVNLVLVFSEDSHSYKPKEIQELMESSYSAEPLHVNDVTPDEGTKLLVHGGYRANPAKLIVNMVGGRLSKLMKAIKCLDKRTDDGIDDIRDLTDDEQVSEICYRLLGHRPK